MDNRYVELAGDTDSETIRIPQECRRTGEIRDMEITVFGNGVIRFAYPDNPDGDMHVVITEGNVYDLWLNGDPV